MPTETTRDTQQSFECASCRETFTGESYSTIDGEVCERCNDIYSTCDECGENVSNDDMRIVRGDNNVCDNCIADYAHCDSCGEYVNLDDYAGDGLCLSCSDDTPVRTRMYAQDDSLKESEAGETIKSARPFGIELEMGFEDSEGLRKAMKALPKCVGIGGDGSIALSNGIELTTPPAVGEKAEDIIRQTCEAINANGAKVDRSCGFHVHLDNSDLQAKSAQRQFEAIRSIWGIYMAFEDVIMSFLPRSRRQNTYCKMLRCAYSYDELLQADNIDILERIWYRVTKNAEATSCKAQAKHTTRYRGINMHTLFAQRHIEIRFHTGTTDYQKIVEWVNLHTRIIDCAVNAGQTDFTEVFSELDLKRKAIMLFDMIRLPENSRDYFLTRQKKFTKAVEDYEDNTKKD